jgi:hypothetical protein
MPESRLGPRDADLVGLAESLLDTCSPSQLDDLVGGLPPMPTAPGLYALVAPDGVTVRVVDEQLVEGDLGCIITRDVVRRLLRPLYEECFGRGLTRDQLAAKSLARYIEMKVLYRLERLGDRA